MCLRGIGDTRSRLQTLCLHTSLLDCHFQQHWVAFGAPASSTGGWRVPSDLLPSHTNGATLTAGRADSSLDLIASVATQYASLLQRTGYCHVIDWQSDWCAGFEVAKVNSSNSQ